MVTPHISVVQVPVNAIGKKRSRVFFFPKLSLNFICFGPSPVLVGNVKSGALVPTVSGIVVLRSKLNRESLNRHLLPDSRFTIHDSRIPWNFSGGCSRSSFLPLA